MKLQLFQTIIYEFIAVFGYSSLFAIKIARLIAYAICNPLGSVDEGLTAEESVVLLFGVDR